MILEFPQLDKYKNYDFGRCPRVYCSGQPCIPVGQSDIPRSSTVKIYCPRCEDIYYPRSKYQGSILICYIIELVWVIVVMHQHLLECFSYSFVSCASLLFLVLTVKYICIDLPTVMFVWMFLFMFWFFWWFTSPYPSLSHTLYVMFHFQCGINFPVDLKLHSQMPRTRLGILLIYF